jgi:anti-anti-sigma factor
MSSLWTSVVTAGGMPTIMLSGVADFSTITYLIEAINEQLLQGVLHLILDVSGLQLADSTAIWLLLLVARVLQAQGGSVVLLRPQPAVAEAVTQADPNGLITIEHSPPI